MDSNILVVSSNGYGKRSKLEDYRITNRGGKGVKTISITEKTGNLVSIKNVNDSNGLMIINKSGIAIRMAVKDLRVMGRATQGVKLINIKEGDSIAAVAKVKHEDEDEDESAVEQENSEAVKTSTEEVVDQESTEAVETSTEEVVDQDITEAVETSTEEVVDQESTEAIETSTEEVDISSSSEEENVFTGNKNITLEITNEGDDDDNDE